jgi:hypothetical protein
VARVTVHYVNNPLRFTGAQRVTVDCVGTVAQAVAAAFPDLAADTLVYVFQGREVDGATAVRDGAHVVAAVRPRAFGIGAADIAYMVVTALVSAAVSYLIGYLLRPKEKKNKAASPAYNVNIEQNAARLGGTVPVALRARVGAARRGRRNRIAEFTSTTTNALSMLLCLGLGDFTVHDIRLGDARVSDFPSGSVTAYVIPPALPRPSVGQRRSVQRRL